MNNLVFVYGTLKQGHGNHRLLQSARLVQRAVTRPEFTMFNLGWFPGVVHHGNTSISGEIYQVNEQEFKALDALEGYPDFYTRKQIDIAGVDDPVWVYLIHPEYTNEKELIPGGEW